MIFRQITHDDLGCASYLVGDEKAGVAAVVDPRFEVDDYLELARYMGVRSFTILRRHMIPNLGSILIIQTVLGVVYAVQAETGLSFLGFGVPPPHPSWGSMLSGSGRTYMYSAPWIAIWPGVAISLVVFGFNMLGDALRDLLDPRLKGG